MTWIAQVILEGMQYLVEVINFMLFIALESVKFSLFGVTTAIQTGKYDYAQEILDTVYPEATQNLWSWLVLYAWGIIPSYPAFASFWYFSRIAAGWHSEDLALAREMKKMGYVKNKAGKWVDPNKKKSGYSKRI